VAFNVRLFSVCFGLSPQISLERGHRTEDTEDLEGRKRLVRTT
jgi:hypothetical protein